jgi:hypothetical protein
MQAIPSRPGFRDMILATFRGKDPGGIVWQPRLEYWYAVNAKRGTLPRPLRKASLLDVYDDCHASVRYFGCGLAMRYRNATVADEWPDERTLRRTWRTPVGTLTEVVRNDEWGLSSAHAEYKLKGPDDFRVLEYLLQDELWSWDQEAYDRELDGVGERGVPQFYFRRSPLQGLFVEHMGFEATVYALRDYSDVVHSYLEVAAAADDALYEVLCRCPVPILNLGENIDAHMDPPPIWRRHLLPTYRKRTAQLHAAGKFVHIHVDGAMKPLLSELAEGPWDGIEAATPLPQGDVTLEEIQAAVGDRVLLDGVPAVYFFPYYPVEELVKCVERIVELFRPRLVLGISDELPPDGEIERVRLVGRMVQEIAAKS